MTTYEDLVDATLPHGLMPLVVPQLKTITLGGAVAGLGIESTSFRDGLPHESVLEMDVLTGTGEIVTAPDDEHPDLFAGFPNSYGTLGYALRLRIELAPVRPFVRLRHIRFDTAEETATALAEITATQRWAAGAGRLRRRHRVLRRSEHYLTARRDASTPRRTSRDYTGQGIYYRSIQRTGRATS